MQPHRFAFSVAFLSVFYTNIICVEVNNINNMSKRAFSDKKYGRGKKRQFEVTENRRPLNRYEMEKLSVENVGTSAKKLSTIDHDDFEVEAGFGYRFVNFLAVSSAISQAVVCKKCKSDVTFTESGNRGLGFKIVISYKNCDKIYISNSPFIEKGYDINRRIILAMRLLGVG